MNISEEQLILVVKKYKHLYDRSNPYYHNNLAKNNSWVEIGFKLNSTDEKCKKKWKSLKESYKRAMKARKTKSGQSAKKVRLWRFESQMEFMKSHLFSQNEEEMSSEEPEDGGIIPNEFRNNQKRKPSLSVGKKSIFEKNNLVRSGTAAKMPNHYMKMKKSVPYRLLIKSQQTSKDPLTRFIQSIEATMRTLPPIIQIKLKSQISELVYKAELEAINIQMPTNPSPPVLTCLKHK